jgi:hypothetical protein
MYTNPVFNVESKVVALVKESLSTVSGCESDETLMKYKQNTRKSWTLLKKKLREVIMKVIVLIKGSLGIVSRLQSAGTLMRYKQNTQKSWTH